MDSILTRSACALDYYPVYFRRDRVRAINGSVIMDVRAEGLRATSKIAVRINLNLISFCLKVQAPAINAPSFYGQPDNAFNDLDLNDDVPFRLFREDLMDVVRYYLKFAIRLPNATFTLYRQVVCIVIFEKIMFDFRQRRRMV